MEIVDSWSSSAYWVPDCIVAFFSVEDFLYILYNYSVGYTLMYNSDYTNTECNVKGGETSINIFHNVFHYILTFSVSDTIM